MSELRFEWDEVKAESNQQKHGISFDEAQTAFYDENARLRHDSENSINDDRYVLLGMSSSLRLLIVCHLCLSRRYWVDPHYFCLQSNEARTATVPSIFSMKEEYDFSQSTKNPYIKKLKKQVTIRLEEEVIIYFKNLSEQTGIPYQSLINLYLQDCVKMQRKPSLEWLSNV